MTALTICLWITATVITIAVPVGIYATYPRKGQPAPEPARRLPADHCGHQPPLSLDQSATECVLRPRHAGSHADAIGMRWWENRYLQQPASTEQPVRHTVDTITSDALDALYERLDDAQETELAKELATADQAFITAHIRATRLAGDLVRARRAHASTVLQAQRQAARARAAEAQLGIVRDVAAWLEERHRSGQLGPPAFFTAMILSSIAATRKERTS